jgi:membrane fusion protein, multidrug efflux system
MNMNSLRLCAVLFLAAGCSKPPAAKPEPAPAPVTVATAVKRTVPIQVRAIGSVKVVATVSVRSRVGGSLTGVHFKEGDYVKKGQKLFTIDPRPYEAAVKQAEATQAKNQAVLRGAELALLRSEQGGTGGAVTGSELDIARTAVASARAAVEADAAAVAAARLQVGFTTITSPLDGRVGELLVNAGNLIDANGMTPLVVVNQMSPIFVTFAIPEAQLATVAAAQRISPLKVTAVLRDTESPVPGTLAFIDNAVNTTSGTVLLKAEFANADRRLWPGQFVDVVLTIGDRPDTVVVPAAAVQAGQQGSYVYIVTAENKAELKPVTVAFEADGAAVLATGLAGGETVVVDGQLRLVTGAKVEAKPATTEKGVPTKVPVKGSERAGESSE